MGESSYARYVAASVLIIAVVSVLYVNLSKEAPEQAQQLSSQYKIAFSRIAEGNEDIFTVDAQGSVVQLTNIPSLEFSPSWSPDRSKLAFVSTRDSNGGDIYVMDADGSNWARLTREQAVKTMPVWSRDGAKIAFLSSQWDVNATKGFDDSLFELYLMNADGSGVQRVTYTAGHVLASQPIQWSRDGKYITFAFGRADDPIVYKGKLDAASGEIVEMSQPGSTNPYLYLSPTASRAAFILTRSSAQPGAYVVDIPSQSGQWLRVTADPTASMEWSPDGSALAFLTPAEGTQSIYIVGANGCCLAKIAEGVIDPLHFLAWAR